MIPGTRYSHPDRLGRRILQPLAYAARTGASMPDAPGSSGATRVHFLPEDEPELLADLIAGFAVSSKEGEA